ncbi:tol-pal system protein YbgF [Sulfitobacter sp. SK012]|uniref:tol-pal system protein YbgF n=1 Tax=Sulfitobacter sp. SK012 TaxID=1389005 RepID=UPI000E0BABCE|nr:tol-pal system protein YbgF [Sulfitobacter sp. SK012]AXI45698.1 tol-pal system protein YbgF [Sulfitobacter sp. SK012]
MRFALIIALGFGLLPLQVAAQDGETLADVRQQLTALSVEVKKLNRELSTTGGGGLSTSGGSVLDRVNAMESELQRLTSKTEELEFRINRVVTDGTRQIGDLEFRLVELEGGDVSTLGETSTLGGEGQPTVTGPAPTGVDPTTQGQLAVSEEADFTRAQEALAAGDFRGAADQFATFNQTYPGGPLAAEADLRRGDALNGLSDVREAARAYLASFGAAPTGPLAPEALYNLGAALGALDQIEEGCVTLGEVPARFPDSAFAAQAQTEKQRLGCQ